MRFPDRRTNDRLVAAERRCRGAHVLLHMLCLAGCALGLAFVVTLLASLASTSGTAHAQSRLADDATPTASTASKASPTPRTPGARELPADRQAAATEPTLWADPGVLSATASRRAIGDAPRPAPRLQRARGRPGAPERAQRAAPGQPCSGAARDAHDPHRIHGRRRREWRARRRSVDRPTRRPRRGAVGCPVALAARARP